MEYTPREHCLSPTVTCVKCGLSRTLTNEEDTLLRENLIEMDKIRPSCECHKELSKQNNNKKLSEFEYNDMTYPLWINTIKEGLERLENISDENEVDHEVFCLKVSVDALEKLLKKYEEEK